MSTTLVGPAAATTRPAARVVLLACPELLSSATLVDALAATPAVMPWSVDRFEPRNADTEPAPDVVVCPAELTEEAAHRHPSAQIVAIVTGPRPGDAVHVALRDGAATCVPTDEPRLVAAFVYAVLRRRGVVAER